MNAWWRFNLKIMLWAWVKQKKTLDHWQDLKPGLSLNTRPVHCQLSSDRLVENKAVKFCWVQRQYTHFLHTTHRDSKVKSVLYTYSILHSGFQKNASQSKVKPPLKPVTQNWTTTNHCCTVYHIMLTIELAHLINMLNFINQCSTEIEMGEFNSTSCNLLNSQGGNTCICWSTKVEPYLLYGGGCFTGN